MTDNLYRKAEFCANIAIVVVAVLLGVVLIKNLLPARSTVATTAVLASQRSATDAPAPSAPAHNVAVSDVDWAKNGRTLLLVLQAGCHYCTESAPFYQRLVQEAQAAGNGVQLVAVLPQETAEAREYLAQLHVPINEVRQASPGELGVPGTPSLLLVNQAGTVEDTWIGKLSPERETEVLNRLQAYHAER
jgi:hypothetical protein